MQNNKLDFNDLQIEDLDTANSSEYKKNFESWLSEDLVRKISASKDEPKWLLDHRLKALKAFHAMPMQEYWPDLSWLDFNKITYFASATDKKNSKNWDDVPEEIKTTFEKLKIPEAEKAVLAWVWAQYESENVYHSIQKEWADLWVLFEDFDVALKKYPEIVEEYFAKVVPIFDHKLSALHYAVMSWGTFLYIPKWVKVDKPLQAYFRMNAEGMGQFEHTLIIIEEWAEWSYIEWCSAPSYWTEALHAWCVEIFVKDWAKFRYSSVENWSKDMFNLNTKRAIIWSNAKMEWIWWQMWSQVTMLYPCSILKWDNSSADHLWIALATKWQNQDTGSKVIISWKNCKANIVSKWVSKDWGIATYRWLVEVKKSADNAIVSVECDSLLFWDSVSDTDPITKVYNSTASVNHEAKAWKISEELLFYLETRWIEEEKAKAMIVNWFLSDVVKTLPLEYAVEMNRLVELEMEGGF